MLDPLTLILYLTTHTFILVYMLITTILNSTYCSHCPLPNLDSPLLWPSYWPSLLLHQCWCITFTNWLWTQSPGPIGLLSAANLRPQLGSFSPFCTSAGFNVHLLSFNSWFPTLLAIHPFFYPEFELPWCARQFKRQPSSKFDSL